MNNQTLFRIGLASLVPGLGQELLNKPKLTLFVVIVVIATLVMFCILPTLETWMLLGLVWLGQGAYCVYLVSPTEEENPYVGIYIEWLPMRRYGLIFLSLGFVLIAVGGCLWVWLNSTPDLPYAVLISNLIITLGAYLLGWSSLIDVFSEISVNLNALFLRTAIIGIQLIRTIVFWGIAWYWLGVQVFAIVKGF